MRRTAIRLAKLRFTYAERNAELAKLPADQRYPLLTTRRAPWTEIRRILSDWQHAEHTTASQPLTTPEMEIRGHVRSVRRASRGLTFVDVEDARQNKLQLVVNRSRLEASKAPTSSQSLVEDLLRRGDAVSALGHPWRTKSGELSLLASEPPVILSACLHPLPERDTTSDVLRQHNRVAELKAFAETRQVLRARDCVMATISDFLRSSHGFIEVQTPVLSSQSGGASATPFKIDHEALFLRVAPELWLKRLVIGGMDRVYEIGPSFRNEGIDATHNPEFTTCELYMAFATLDDLMNLTSELLNRVGTAVAAEFPEYAMNCQHLVEESGKYQVLDFVPSLEKALGKPLHLDISYLQRICVESGIAINGPGEDDEAHLLDKLAGHFLEPQCVKPTFITNHPQIMAPLAKSWQRDGWTLSRRFELLINGREYVNAYEEENDPGQQLEKLRAQNPAVPDRPFVEALEWGLPPTGGWGLGIDRLVMLVTGSTRIGQVLSFGGLNQVNRQ